MTCYALLFLTHSLLYTTVQVARLLSGGCAYFAWSGAGAGDLSLNTARLAREEGGAEADYLANKVTSSASKSCIRIASEGS